MSANKNSVFDPLEGDVYNQDDEVTRGAVRAIPQIQPLLGSPEWMEANNLNKERKEVVSVSKQASNVEEEVVRSRGGAVWSARKRSEEHADFYYRSTTLTFPSGTTTVPQLVEQIYQFCDRKFDVELQKVNPKKGTFNLAVFVKESLVMVKLRIYEESDRSYIMEVELRDGEPLAFGTVYRDLKNDLQPSSTAIEQQIKDDIDSLDLSIDVLMEQGIEFPAPAPEEWELILEECQVPEKEHEHVVNSGTIASSVESLSSIAQTYEAEDLEFLSKNIAEKRIGFVHDKYDVEKENATYQQLWSMSLLLQHLSKSPDNVKHIKELLPVIDNAIRTTVNNKDVWFSVVDKLCMTFLVIVKTCKESSIELPNGINKDIIIPADYAQKYNNGMVEENKLFSKSVEAQKHLNEAYNLITA